MAASLAAGTALLAGCGPDGETENLTDKPLAPTTVIADWSKGEISDDIFASGSQGWGWGNGGVFNTWWSADCVTYGEKTAKLSIKPNTDPENEDAEAYDYLGGEMRTYGYYGYGDYQVRMKPAKKDGTASTFFVCTGEYDLNPITNEKNPWDEIDIEFLGQDTTKVQFNYFVNGVGGHEYMYDLGFDASEEFHNYGFRWAEDYITWFVDDKPVYRVEASEGKPMPAASGRILTNYWCGTDEAKGWMGSYSNPGDEGPEYEWIKTSAKVEWTDSTKPKPPEEVDPITPDGEVTEIDLSKVTVGGSLVENDGVYTTEVKDGKLNVTYSDYTHTGNYENVELQGLTSDIKANNVLTAKITNNGTAGTVNVRVNVTATKVGNNESCNLEAMQDGQTAPTDLNWGGSTFTVEAGNTIEIAIVYDNEREVKNIQFMIDSHVTTVENASGDITISDMTLFTQADGEGETPEEPEEPVTPPSETPVTVDVSKVTIQGSIVANDGPYTATAGSDNTINVKYDAVKGNSYLNVELAGMTADAQTHNVFTATIKNNGTETVNVRVNIQSTAQITANTQACNISATQDGVEVRTDTEWGGSFFTVEAGKTITIEIVYDYTQPQNVIQFMIDSHMGTDTTHSGDITIGGMVFSSKVAE
ncbi:MAG TPA: family 16 glycosylhydrolase [Candidatus Coproplasma stercorigallinarum]|nr:family 16 glycosylhydrolase [Candidatus Coproplasma stercorigallinarum]